MLLYDTQGKNGWHSIKACLACCAEIASCQLPFTPPTAVSSSMACSVPDACFWDHWSDSHFNKDLHYIKGEEETRQDRHLEMQECCWPKGAEKANALPFLWMQSHFLNLAKLVGKSLHCVNLFFSDHRSNKMVLLTHQRRHLPRASPLMCTPAARDLIVGVPSPSESLRGTSLQPVKRQAWRLGQFGAWKDWRWELLCKLMSG